MRNKLKIGEFSKLCRVTIKTLRHYEELGLLCPAEIDDYSGYRYYEIGQAVRLNRILHLKCLGLSLDEIRELFEQGADRPEVELIREKIRLCREQIAVLTNRLDQLQCLENETIKTKDMKKFEIKVIPSRIVASHRQVIKSYDEMSYLCYAVIGPEMMRVGCTCPEPQYCYTVEHDKEHKDSDIDVEYCEAVGEMHDDTNLLKFYRNDEIKALCYRYVGPYTSFGDAMAEILSYAQGLNMKITGSPRFSYIDGPWNKENPADYVTEIQLPIE